MLRVGGWKHGDEAVKMWPSHFILTFAHTAVIDLSLFAGVSMQTWKVAYRGMCLSCYIKHCSFQQHLSISCSSSVQDTTQLHTHLLCPRGFSCRSIITNLCRVNKQCLTLHNFSILLELKCFTLI